MRIAAQELVPKGVSFALSHLVESAQAPICARGHARLCRRGPSRLLWFEEWALLNAAEETSREARS
jgi:hypothetical protein